MAQARRPFARLAQGHECPCCCSAALHVAHPAREDPALPKAPRPVDDMTSAAASSRALPQVRQHSGPCADAARGAGGLGELSGVQARRWAIPSRWARCARRWAPGAARPHRRCCRPSPATATPRALQARVTTLLGHRSVPGAEPVAGTTSNKLPQIHKDTLYPLTLCSVHLQTR